MLDCGKYNTEGIARQELTYERQRGYWHWRCQICARQGQERIPDKAQDHHYHNPGNPALMICGRCTEYRFDPAITLKGKRKRNKPQELTYKRQRGYWYWRCQICARQGQERIPDKAQDHHYHNPGNPALMICGRCTEYRFDPARITLKGKRKRNNGKAMLKDSLDPETDLEADLDGIWGDYMAIARQFERKAIYQDREDLRHNIILTLAEVDRNNGHKPLTQAAMNRIASRTVADYWRGQYRHTNGLDCRWCSKDQHKDCREHNLYPSCPKAIRLESLSKPITDQDGNITELGQLIADDKAIDVLDWVEVNTWQLGYPGRLVSIADKIRRGEALSGKDREYLRQYRRKAQGKLF
ncbi:MAG: hypothetical protein DDT29_01073 [Dehalococcoidia bacterium]|nr:hypothetical protein [Bacillota bacterium]